MGDIEQSLPAKSVLFNIALEIVISHVQLEFKTLLNIEDTRVGAALSVDFAVKQFRCLNLSNHVSSTAVNGHVVTRRQFIGSGFRYFQVRILQEKVNVTHCLTTHIVIGIYSMIP